MPSTCGVPSTWALLPMRPRPSAFRVSFWRLGHLIWLRVWVMVNLLMIAVPERSTVVFLSVEHVLEFHTALARYLERIAHVGQSLDGGFHHVVRIAAAFALGEYV